MLLKLKFLSDQKLIIPEYKIELYNKSKKLLNLIENINHSIETKNNQNEDKKNKKDLKKSKKRTKKNKIKKKFEDFVGKKKKEILNYSIHR